MDFEQCVRCEITLWWSVSFLVVVHALEITDILESSPDIRRFAGSRRAAARRRFRCRRRLRPAVVAAALALQRLEAGLFGAGVALHAVGTAAVGAAVRVLSLDHVCDMDAFECAYGALVRICV